MAQNAAFLPSFETNIWAVAQTNPTARKTYFVPTTNADRLIVVSNAATTNLQVTAGNPDGDSFGPVNYVPTSTGSTNTFTLIASNSVNNSFASTNLTITVQPLPPLEVRFFDMRAEKTVPVQILPVGTGANDKAGDCSFFYVNNGTVNLVTNGYSVGASNLPTATTINNITGESLPYQTLYVSNVQSGTIWIGLTEQAYTDALDPNIGNPAAAAAPGLQWSQAPFGEIEYSYTGGGYDTADVTMINSIAVPALLRLANSNGLYPGSVPVGVTNSNTLATTLPGIRLQPGASWFGPAPNTNLIRLVGPSSALNGAIQIANGDATNTSGPADAGNYYTGWPGFHATPMSPYVSKVALATTNPTPGNSNSTRIEKLIGDPDAESWCAQSLWYFAADLTFKPNTNQLTQWGPLSSNYVTPVPVLTNVTMTNIVTFTNGAKVTNSWTTGNLAAAYTPDSGSPTNSVFSFYIYAAPASFNGPANQGYVTFYAEGATNQFAWTNLANYTNSNYGAGQNQNSPNWNPYVLDAFLNEIAFGFAGGFVHSPVMGYTNGWQYNAQGRITNNTNSSPPNVPIGSMTSPQWWQQTNLYSQLQPDSPEDYTWYSKWGNSVFAINPSIYSHPISDRMEYEGFTPGLPLGAANTNTNVWLEVYFYDVPAPAPSANRPAISLIKTNGVAIPSTNFPYVTTANRGALAPTNNNLFVVQMTNADPDGWQPQFVFPSMQVTTTNTNGGGLRIGSLPSGLSYDPATRTITGTLGADLAAGGYASIGLMPYSSNDLTVATIPIYVAPVDTDPTVTNVLVTNSYPTNVNVSAVAMPGETITIKGYNFTNYPGIPPLNQVQFVNGPVLTNGFTVVDSTTITATLPATNWTSAYNGSVIVQRVFTNGNSQLSTNGVGWTKNFGIPMPQISGFDPTSAQSGSSITLSGFFYGVTNVVFFKHLASETATTNFTAPSYPYTNLVVTVPSGPPSSTAGLLEVKSLYLNLTPNLATNAVSSANFTLAAPAVAPVGPINPPNLGALNLYSPRYFTSFSQFPPWGDDAPAGALQVLLSNNSSMTVASGASWSATGLPRGLYLVNYVQGVQVYGQIIGAAVDPGSSNLAITASNSAGVTNFTVPLVINTNLTSLGAASNAPVLYGPTIFSAATNAYTNLVVTYSNGPTYFALSGLPPGMSNTLTVVETPNPVFHGLKDGQFALSVYGTPTTPGAYTVTSTAVNVVTNNQGAASAMTNVTNFTITVTGSGPSYLSYDTWTGAWALSGPNTNPTADPDGDGFDNNEEYAFGGNPTNPTPYLLNISGSNISYIGLTNNAVPSPYTVQNTTNLATGPWTNYAVTLSNATDQLNIPLPTYYQRKEFTVPITPGTNNFYRVIFSNQ